ncbi:MAG: prepilin-type N-terminal cleavage/methylation domain-containing protein [Planctomycetota bacterium]
MEYNRSRAFTLVEMLAVIAMIAVLAALLLPTLQSHERCGRRTGCASNLSQIAKGMYIYSTTFHCYPTTATGADPFAVTGSTLPSLNVLYPNWIQDVRVFRCPDSRESLNLAGIVPAQNGHLQDAGAAMVSSYGYDPGHNPEDDEQSLAAIAGDKKGKEKNSDNHTPNAGQNLIIGQGTIEWHDTIVNFLGWNAPAGKQLRDDDIFNLDAGLPRKVDSYVRQ